MNPLLESIEESQSVSTLFVNYLETFLFRCTFSHVISVSVLQLPFNWLSTLLLMNGIEEVLPRFLIRWLFLLLRVSPSFSGIKSSSLQYRLLLAYLWISRPLLSVVHFTSIRFSSKVQCECVIHRFIVVRSKEPSKEVEQKRRWREWIINYSSEGTRRLSKVQGSAIVQVQQQ